MPNHNILSELIKVSRNCGFTLELSKILTEKLSDKDLEVLHRWLQIVNEEKTIETNRAKTIGRRY